MATDMILDCELCGEKGAEPYVAIGVVESVTGTRQGIAHKECMLRAVLGGIGHLVAHEYWCVQKSDPDAGLTYRQSALLADAYQRIVRQA